jgi:hypothetical protein
VSDLNVCSSKFTQLVDDVDVVAKFFPISGIFGERTKKTFVNLDDDWRFTVGSSRCS